MPGRVSGSDRSCLRTEAQDPDLQIAVRAVEQIQAARRGETYDALAADLPERFRKGAARLPETERDRRVEILGAAVVWRGEGFTEVAVVARTIPRDNRLPLMTRTFVRVQNGRAVRIFPTMP